MIGSLERANEQALARAEAAWLDPDWGVMNDESEEKTYRYTATFTLESKDENAIDELINELYNAAEDAHKVVAVGIDMGEMKEVDD